MKRFACFLTAVLMLLPTVAAAQTSSPSCAVLNGVEPVSPYVRAVLERADAGIATADALPGTTADDFLQYAGGWLRTVDTALRSMVDSQLRVISQQRDLTDATACLHIDRALIQCKMVTVIDHMHTAFGNASWQGLWTLGEVLKFLQERERQLLRGSLAPRYRDLDWSRRKPFDPEDAPFGTPDETEEPECGDAIISYGEECDDGNTSSGDGCTSECLSEVCPFHSNYAEDSLMGGCSASVLEAGNRMALPSAAAEHDSLLFLEESFAGFRANAAAAVAVQQEIAGLVRGEAGVAPVPAALPPRQEVAGCVMGPGYCSGVPSMRCEEDNDCVVVNGGECVIDTLQNIAFWPPRHSLSVEPDHLRILIAFQERRKQQGAARKQRSDLLARGELKMDGSQVVEGPMTVGAAALLPVRRAYYRKVSEGQGALEASAFAESADPQRIIAESMKPLRGSVAAIARLVQDPEGLRGLLTRFAYFLLRSCMDRSCSLLLQQVTKIAQTDACFPYANGQYLTHDCNNPSWKVCADAIMAEESAYMGGPSFDPFNPPLPTPTCEE